MKKSNLMFATALLSVLLATGLAPAVSAAEAAKAPGAASAQTAAPGWGPGMMGRASVQLSPEKEKIVQAAADKLRADSKPLYQEQVKLWKESHDLLTAKTFDKAAYLAKQGEIAKNRAKLDEMRAQAVADTAASLAPEERAGLPRAFMPHRGPRGGMMEKGAWGNGPGGMMNGQRGGAMNGPRGGMMGGGAPRDDGMMQEPEGRGDSSPED